MTKKPTPLELNEEALKIAIKVYWQNRQATHDESIAEAIQAYLKYVNSPYWVKPPLDENKLVEEMAKIICENPPVYDGTNAARAILPLIRKAIGGGE